jgi:predicted SnoaL-like aldol condensation-catalyzing enzyme
VSENTELVRKAIQRLFVERDLTAIDELWAADYQQHNPMIPDGTAALAGFVSSLPENFNYEIGITVGDGDMVMMHGRIIGLGPKPVVVVDIFRIENGRLAEHWDVIQEEVPTEQTASGRPMFSS